MRQTGIRKAIFEAIETDSQLFIYHVYNLYDFTRVQMDAQQPRPRLTAGQTVALR